jgi:hypothetical protein
MTGGSIGHCTTGSWPASSGTSNAASIRGQSTAVFTGLPADPLSTTSSEDTGASSVKGVSTASVRGTSTLDCGPSNDGTSSGTLATFAVSAPLLRARLTPARSVQRAAFSAMLRSVSCTLAGGATFCVVGIGRVKLGG